MARVIPVEQLGGFLPPPLAESYLKQGSVGLGVLRLRAKHKDNKVLFFRVVLKS